MTIINDKKEEVSMKKEKLQILKKKSTIILENIMMIFCKII